MPMNTYLTVIQVGIIVRSSPTPLYVFQLLSMDIHELYDDVPAEPARNNKRHCVPRL